MTDINNELLNDFQKRLIQEWQILDTESKHLFIEAEEQVRSLKLDIEVQQNNLEENCVMLAKELRSSDTRFVEYSNELDKKWSLFDTNVRNEVLNFREYMAPDLSYEDMAGVYDRATDKNCYDEVPADKFKYQEHLPSSQLESDNSGTSDSDSRGSQIKKSLSRFRTDPSIEKRIKAINNRYKRNLVIPSVKFLKTKCEKLNNKYQDVVQRDDSGNDEKTKRLLARLFIKLARHPEVRKDVWNEDNLKLLFGVSCTEKILKAFSYPLSDAKYIKNFNESAEYLNNIFKASVISDFDFSKIRTEFLHEFLINLFHCYINPVYFNKELLLVIAQELESKFAITWDALMNENCEYMRSNCPERNFGELYFLGQMSREGYYKISDETDRELVRRIDDYSIKVFKLIKYPLVFELFNKEFTKFFQCYDFIKKLYENDHDDQVKKQKEVQLQSNIARQFKRHLVLSFIETVTEIYKKDGMTFVISGDNDVSIEDGNHLEKIRESINNIYPDDVALYLQPRCRDILEEKMETEYLGKVFMFGINICVFIYDEHTTALKVIKNNQNCTLYMKCFKSYENALDYVRGVGR